VAIGAAALILLSLAINTAIGIAGSYFQAGLPLPAPVLHLVHFLVSLVLTTAVFTLVYKTLPDAYVAWGDAAAGALVTALLFDLGSFVLSAFVSQAGCRPMGQRRVFSRCSPASTTRRRCSSSVRS
jgi:membrane protein